MLTIAKVIKIGEGCGTMTCHSHVTPNYHMCIQMSARKKVGPRMGLGKSKYNPLRIDLGPQEKAITTSCFVSTLPPLRLRSPGTGAAAGPGRQVVS